MKTVFRILLTVMVIALSATPLKAVSGTEAIGFKWCGEFAFDTSHPLFLELDEHRQLLRNTPWEDQIVKRKGFYKRLLDKFNALYSGSDDFNDPRVRATVAALNMYINDLDIKGETPTLWMPVHVFQNKNIMKFSRIKPYVGSDTHVAMSCDVFKDPKAGSAVLGAAYLARYMEWLGQTGLKELKKGAAAEADLVSKGYQSWLFKGLAQWPWELKVNEFFIPEEFNGDARDWQLTVMRPNVGFAINPNDYNDADLDYALMLEPVGFVKYLEKDGKTDYEHWWGVSALVSITDGGGTGYGLMARYDNFILGACKHDSQNQDWLIYFGVDFYKYLLGENGKARQYKELADSYLK